MTPRERPILFSAPMVLALLDGRKTQTRRVVSAKFPRWGPDERPDTRVKSCPHGEPGDKLWARETWALARPVVWDEDRGASYVEEWADWPGKIPKRHPVGYSVLFRSSDGFDEGESADERGFVWRPSIFMPRWASRIDLDLTEVRVQRLQDISEEDAKAEGCAERVIDPAVDNYVLSARHEFGDLWDSINSKRAPWDANPWVWALTFRKVKP